MSPLQQALMLWQLWNCLCPHCSESVRVECKYHSQSFSLELRFSADMEFLRRSIFYISSCRILFDSALWVYHVLKLLWGTVILSQETSPACFLFFSGPPCVVISTCNPLSCVQCDDQTGGFRTLTGVKEVHQTLSGRLLLKLKMRSTQVRRKELVSFSLQKKW